MLFIFFLSSAAGVLLGGVVGDRIGRYRIIWISILGPLPLTLLLPHVDFFWTGVLTVLINLIMASAFASIMIYALALVPHRIGLVGGRFMGSTSEWGELQQLSSEGWQIGSALKRSISFAHFCLWQGF